jgi:hypothetical protein
VGCLFSINPDAHSTRELDLMRWGIAMARKGGVPPDRVLNTKGLAAFEAWLAQRRTRRSRPAARRLSGPPRRVTVPATTTGKTSVRFARMKRGSSS